MPELPEVETVRRGLAPVLEGSTIRDVVLNRPDLRFPFPPDFQARLRGQQIVRLSRRAKYIIATLGSGEHLIIHLGMTGRFNATGAVAGGAFHHQVNALAHTHVEFSLVRDGGAVTVSYADPRRFGFMDLVEADQLNTCRHFAKMGIEPLSDALDASSICEKFAGRKSPLKAALLDQRLIAGLGNIYVCEALFRSRLSPRRQAGTVGPARAERLAIAIRDVLSEAVAAGGSTLRDFAAVDGSLGYFQHRFDVYDREGEPCPVCAHAVRRMVQSGRSTYFCGQCQR